MNVQREHDEPQPREGLGGRVRRFINDELSRARDKDDSPPDAPATPATEPATSATPATPATEPATSAPPVTPAAAQQTTPPRADGHRTDQTAADRSAERVGLLNDPAGLRNQWQQVQGTFVDDPQRAVHEASVLVDRTLREIHENVTRGQISDPTSTEDLRVSFQRYREFFQRLLSV